MLYSSSNSMPLSSHPMSGSPLGGQLRWHALKHFERIVNEKRRKQSTRNKGIKRAWKDERSTQPWCLATAIIPLNSKSKSSSIGSRTTAHRIRILTCCIRLRDPSPSSPSSFLTDLEKKLGSTTNCSSSAEKIYKGSSLSNTGYMNAKTR